jgi:hypothetical protein
MAAFTERKKAPADKWNELLATIMYAFLVE